MTLVDLFRLAHGGESEPAPPPSSRRSGTTTGTFSPIEADFFARAADLYPEAVAETDAWEMRVAAAKCRG